MDEQAVDVVVVGLGPGGEHASIKLAGAGLSVVSLDPGLVGGECPYYGCVPSKMMVAAAHSLAAVRVASELAGSAEVHPDWSPVAKRVREEATHDWDDRVAVERLEKAGARFVRARGRLAGEGRVEADGTTYVARLGVVVNTGTSPAVPPIDGLDGTPYWTNRDLVRLTSLPASLVVLGGGTVGVEFGQALARFGVEVTLVEGVDRILPSEEPEASALAAEALSRDGIRILTGNDVSRVTHADGTFSVEAGDHVVTAERLLVATGRTNNLDDLGLETMGLDPDAQVIETDERMRAADKLWAVGDITGKGGYTHVSMYQARMAVRDLLGKDGPWADYRAVPRVTFTEPEVASVGLTEAQARKEGLDVRIGMSKDLGARGWISATDGLIKLVADGDRLVGGTSVGPAGGEVLSMISTAIHARVPVTTFLDLHFAYPAYYRAIETALKDML
ncbi:MAG TPA: NAD(P)/FAD-dependent oxidoreductase [Intrasporangium sp.]|nr:NAD(P)/FAD-dependent oxidoreductase [Intrasporangium sp.]